MLTRLGSKLAGWSPQRGADGDPIETIRAAWPDIVGSDVARHCRPERLSAQTLAIVTRSSAWSQQLALLSETIISAIDRLCPQGTVLRLRFRVGRSGGRLAEVPPALARAPHASGASYGAPAADAAEALARLRSRVGELQRANGPAATKKCSDCHAPIERGTLCAPCAGAQAQERRSRVVRLQYETPWLAYEGIAELVPGLTADEYEAIRVQTLQRWWNELHALTQRRRAVASDRERSLASSFVLLKTGIAPDAVSEAVLRNELGDDLHEILYGKELRNQP